MPQPRDAEVVRAMFAADTVLNAIVVRKGPRPPAARATGYTNPNSALPDVYNMSRQTGGAAMDGIGPGQLHVKELIERVAAEDYKEVVIATNPNAEGEATALYLSRLLSPSGVAVTRLARMAF